jgi:hypothetical protein
MSSSNGRTGTDMSSVATDPAAIEAEIERQREELAQTVDHLRDRLDVKSDVEQVGAAAKARAHEAKERATTPEGRPRPSLMAVAAAVAAVPVIVIVWKNRQRLPIAGRRSRADEIRRWIRR